MANDATQRLMYMYVWERNLWQNFGGGVCSIYSIHYQIKIVAQIERKREADNDMSLAVY